MAEKKICKIDGCGKPMLARGWCSAHWTRWKRHGNPLAGKTVIGAPKDFFNAALGFQGEDCLVWPYAKDANGYAQIRLRGSAKYVQREICTARFGPPAKGYVAAHSCGNGHLGCVNPRHIRWATSKENAADRTTHGTEVRGSNVPGSKLTPAQVMQIRGMKGKETHEKIALLFGVSRQTVSDIISRRRWAWLKDEQHVEN